MSIATEITRLQNAKAAIKTAIEGKGVTVPDATLMDGMAALIDAIEAGGGGGEYSNTIASTIGNYAFYQCQLITSVSFTNATSVGAMAFSECNKLRTASLPKATSITASFSNCAELESISFLALTQINGSAFMGCSKLTSLVLSNTSKVCSLGVTWAFNNTPIASGTGYIYVPDALVDSYKAATNWSTYAAQIKPLSEYTEA